MKLHNLSGCTVSILQELRSLRAATVGQLKEVILNYTIIRNRLRTPLIPAQAQRVYREILEQLPPILCEALLPITRLVEAHNAH